MSSTEQEETKSLVDQVQPSLIASRLDSAIQSGLDSLGSLSPPSSSSTNNTSSLTSDSSSSHGFGDSAAVKEFGGAQSRSSTGGFDKGLGGPNGDTAMGSARGQGGPGTATEGQGLLSSISDTVSSVLGGSSTAGSNNETSNAALREGGVQRQSRTGQAMSGVHGGHADRT